MVKDYVMILSPRRDLAVEFAETPREKWKEAHRAERLARKGVKEKIVSGKVGRIEGLVLIHD